KDKLLELEIRRRKDNVLRRLQANNPLNRTTRLVIFDGTEATSDPRRMAVALQTHWSGTFAEKPVHHLDRRKEWLARGYYGIHKDRPTTPHSRDINREHVASAIKFSNNSSPGPDGVPYAV
ncbi:MAG: hypothetical protein ACKPKO_10670, partial [Candidatus Fonsibacter sp.]